MVIAFTYLSSLKCGTGNALYTTGKLMLHFIVLRLQMKQTERKKKQINFVMKYLLNVKISYD